MRDDYFEDFLDFAIRNEKEAAETYEKYSHLVKSAAQKELLADMSHMERGHEKKLLEFKQTGAAHFPKQDAIQDLQISDFMVDIQIKEDTSLEDVFIYSMKAEQKAFELYTRLAALEEKPHVKELFSNLAADEKKHKHDLEAEFDKGILSEN